MNPTRAPSFVPGRKIKVLHFVSKLDTGGMENGVINLCNRIDKKRYEPGVICLHGAGAMADRLQADVPCVSLGLPEGRSLVRPFQVYRLFKRIRPDIVHTHGWGSNSLDGIAGALLGRVPVIINGEHGKFYTTPLQRRLQRFLYSRCDTVLSVSGALKEEIVQRLGVPPERIRVIRNGVDTRLFTGQHDVSAFRREMADVNGWPQNGLDFVIGCVGSLKKEKNPFLILDALEALIRKDARVRLVFVGTGPLRPAVEEAIRSRRLSRNAACLGERKDIPRIMSFIRILVSASRKDHEGLSNVMLEALASGVPVVTTASVGALEVVEDGVNGFVVPENDTGALVRAFHELAASSERYAGFSRRARERAATGFSIETMVDGYASAYETLYKAHFNPQRCLA